MAGVVRGGGVSDGPCGRCSAGKQCFVQPVTGVDDATGVCGGVRDFQEGQDKETSGNQADDANDISPESNACNAELERHTVQRYWRRTYRNTMAWPPGPRRREGGAKVNSTI